MTREQHIRETQAKFLKAMSDGRRLRAAIYFAQLSSLKTKQIKAEIRAERKSA